MTVAASDNLAPGIGASSTAAPFPTNENARLQALRDLHILDTDHDERFDRVAKLVKMHFGMPVVRISFVDSDRTWFKSCIGLNVRQAPREISICAHTILQNDVLVCHDLQAHPVLKASPQVIGSPGFRFYAGAPITLDNGFNVGSVCLMDYEARHEFDDRDEGILNDFASIVVHELELNRQLAESALALTLAEHTAGKATSTNAEVLNFISNGLNPPLRAIDAYGSQLIERLQPSHPDCAQLAQAIKNQAADLTNEIHRLMLSSED
jgi:GAF domain-containing protein